MDIAVIRFWNSDVTDNIENIIAKIKEKLSERKNYFVEK